MLLNSCVKQISQYKKYRDTGLNREELNDSENTIILRIFVPFVIVSGKKILSSCKIG